MKQLVFKPQFRPTLRESLGDLGQLPTSVVELRSGGPTRQGRSIVLGVVAREAMEKIAREMAQNPPSLPAKTATPSRTSNGKPRHCDTAAVAA